jgi:membrane protein implicated in regulation of membrane protease activity
MTWSDFYLVCFLVGLILSAVSFLFGSAHLHFPHHGGGAHLHLGHGHGHGGQRGTSLSFFNFATATAFLAWFGGVGFLLTRYSSIWIWWALTGAIVAGLAGAAVVFWFVAKLLIGSERDLDPADYDLIGALGRLSTNIRDGGTGEMIFSQQGSRRSIAARHDGPGAIPKGTEVVITRYEKGIAYVQRWDELTVRQVPDLPSAAGAPEPGNPSQG